MFVLFFLLELRLLIMIRMNISENPRTLYGRPSIMPGYGFFKIINNNLCEKIFQFL